LFLFLFLLEWKDKKNKEKTCPRLQRPKIGIDEDEKGYDFVTIILLAFDVINQIILFILIELNLDNKNRIKSLLLELVYLFITFKFIMLYE